MSHCWISTAELEGVSAEGKSSEAKVTVADLLCPSLVLAVFSLLPSISTHGRRSALFPLLFLLGCHSRSSSHALTLPRSSCFHSLLASILVNLLSSPTASWSIRLAAPSLLRCPILDASSSLPHPLCLLLAVSSSLSYPCCLILAASPSLQRPRSNFSSSHPSHC